MKRALVIEDNEDNMLLITFILEKKGIATLRAETGNQGIALAKRERPDFILLDIQLPDMDGLDVLRQLRKSPETREIKTIAVTSYAMTGDRERLIAAGCDGYIEKPIDPETIMSEIKRIIGGGPWTY